MKITLIEIVLIIGIVALSFLAGIAANNAFTDDSGCREYSQQRYMDM